MSGYTDPPGVIESFKDLRGRIEALERRQWPPHYTTANRPAAATVEGLIIYNTTTQKGQQSNGTVWSDLF